MHLLDRGWKNVDAFHKALINIFGHDKVVLVDTKVKSHVPVMTHVEVSDDEEEEEENEDGEGKLVHYILAFIA